MHISLDLSLVIPVLLVRRWVSILETIHDLGMTPALVDALAEGITEEGGEEDWLRMAWISEIISDNVENGKAHCF